MSDATTAPEGIGHVLQAATDAVTDDMVARLSEATAQGLDLLDRVNRSGLDRALPAIAELVHNGDLDRLVRLARVYGSAEDALTDEMIGRLTETVGGGLDLLDRVNRSNLADALPVLSRLAANGDLDRVAQVARMLAAAGDSLTDEMVSRLAETFSEAIAVVDRLNRSGVGKLVDLLERLDASGALEKLADRLPRLIDRLDILVGLTDALVEAGSDSRRAQPSSGGVMEAVRLLGDPSNQAALRFALAAARKLEAKATPAGS